MTRIHLRKKDMLWLKVRGKQYHERKAGGQLLTPNIKSPSRKQQEAGPGCEAPNPLPVFHFL